jgi:hypothetical protein
MPSVDTGRDQITLDTFRDAVAFARAITHDAEGALLLWDQVASPRATAAALGILLAGQITEYGEVTDGDRWENLLREVEESIGSEGPAASGPSGP